MANEGDVFFNFIAADILNQARQQAGQEAIKVIQLAIDGLERAVKNRPKTIENIYRKVAQDATDAMGQAYRSRPYRTDMSGVPYRNDDNYVGASGRSSRRYAGGLLGAALTSPNMYHVTKDGISFINKAHLDKAARQWYRLNFGIGARGAETPPAPHFKMQIFGEVLPGDIGLFSYQRKPGSFRLPSGWWSSTWPASKSAKVPYDSGRRGMDAFVRRGYGPKVGAYGKSKTSLGIQGSRFLDAGVGALVDGFPRAIEAMISGWLAEAQQTTKANKGPLGKIKVAPSKAALRSAQNFIDRLHNIG